METLAVPADVKHVEIFADNDASYTGQAAAYALAKRLTEAGREVTVWMPPETDTDWADHAAKL